MVESVPISKLPRNAVFHYENGVLDAVGKGEQMRLHGWHDPKAFWRDSRQDWSPFTPAFPVVRPNPSPARPGSPQLRHVTPPLHNMQAVFDAFQADLPSNVAQALEGYSGFQWNLLLLIHRQPETLDLIQGSPALAWCLANCDAFRPIYRRPAVEWAAALVGRKQAEILKWLGFPGTDSTVKLLRKLGPSCIDPASMRMLCNTLRDSDSGTKMLRHQSRINAGVHRLCCYRRLADAAAPSLVNEAAADPQEEDASPRADLLGDTLSLWETLDRDVCPPVFRSLRRIQTVHDELVVEYQQTLAAERPRPRREKARRRSSPRKRTRTTFMKPPVPGTRDIIPLCSKAELEREASDQHNCVGIYYQRIKETRDLYVYKVLRPQRATLSLIRRPDGSWRRGELAASRNRRVRIETRIAVDYWLQKSTVYC